MTATATNSSGMAFTGERMVPEAVGLATFWEHVYRYRFARRFVRGRRVLDCACGEGYGTRAMLDAGACSVLGVDISEEACQHASAKYDVPTRCGSALSMPCATGEVQVVVSFETVEHLSDADGFLRECRRVLEPGGTLVISTPDRTVYSAGGHHNDFHEQEMDAVEFEALCRRHFDDVTLHGQARATAPRWSAASLSAVKSPWENVRGFWRLRQALCHASDHRGDVSRRDAVAEILSDETSISAAVNPYVVRPLRRGDRSTYLLAVCR